MYVYTSASNCTLMGWESGGVSGGEEWSSGEVVVEREVLERGTVACSSAPVCVVHSTVLTSFNVIRTR